MTDAPTPRSEVRRHDDRAEYDIDAINAILDEALICHVGFVADGSPVVIPTIHSRIGNTLYFHGSPASRMLRLMKHGTTVCVTATIVDGLVIAATPFNQSMNYRSVVAFGETRVVDDPDEKLRALEAVTEHITPGRWADSRPSTDKEIQGTLVAAITLDEASAKVRTGPPIDDEADLELDYWTGVIPLSLEPGTPEPSDGKTTEAPEYVRMYRRP
jgi:nitroimidazol reductase NimA-like FMN-containing flavoprotein (pyridoxamine 5'-phosphate oxidase superfamily)